MCKIHFGLKLVLDYNSVIMQGISLKNFPGEFPWIVTDRRQEIKYFMITRNEKYLVRSKYFGHESLKYFLHIHNRENEFICLVCTYISIFIHVDTII